MTTADAPLVAFDPTGRPIDVAGLRHDVALVAFGGLTEGVGMPPLEFFGLTRDWPVNRIFVRDPRGALYQRPIPGLGSTLSEICDHIADAVAGQRRVVLVGNSSGAYAAMAAGLRIPRSRVLAFAPVTFLNRRLRRFHRDRRWAKYIEPVNGRDHPEPEVLDLKGLYRTAPERPDVDLYYARNHRLDRVHARRMRRIDSLTVHPLEERDHGFIRKLRDDGRLVRMLRQALTLD